VQKQIPRGNDRKKGNGKGKSKSKGKKQGQQQRLIQGSLHCALRASVEMTALLGRSVVVGGGEGVVAFAGVYGVVGAAGDFLRVELAVGGSVWGVGETVLGAELVLDLGEGGF